jgi:hypothetical protein
MVIDHSSLRFNHLHARTLLTHLLTLQDAHPPKIFAEACLAALEFIVPMIDSDAHGPYLFNTHKEKLLGVVVAPMDGSVLMKKAILKQQAKQEPEGAPPGKKQRRSKPLEPVAAALAIVADQSSAASSESGTLQPQVGGAADGSENATEEPGVVPKPAKKATAASAGRTLKLQLKVSFIQSPNKNRCYIILFSAGWIAIKITRRRGRLRSE